jgi:hypothetical protein
MAALVVLVQLPLAQAAQEGMFTQAASSAIIPAGQSVWLLQPAKLMPLPAQEQQVPPAAEAAMVAQAEAVLAEPAAMAQQAEQPAQPGMPAIFTQEV